MFKVYDIVDYKFSPSISIEMKNDIVKTCQASASTNDTKKIVDLLGTASDDDQRIVIAVYEILYNLYLGNITLDDIAGYLNGNGYAIDHDGLYKYTSDAAGGTSALNILYAIIGATVGASYVLTTKSIKAMELVVKKASGWWETLKTIDITKMSSDEVADLFRRGWSAIYNAANSAIKKITKTDLGNFWGTLTPEKFADVTYDTKIVPVKLENMVISYDSDEALMHGSARSGKKFYDMAAEINKSYNYSYVYNSDKGNYDGIFSDKDIVGDKFIFDNTIFLSMAKDLITPSMCSDGLSNNRSPITASTLYVSYLDGKPFYKPAYNDFAKWSINTPNLGARSNLDRGELYDLNGWFFTKVCDVVNLINVTNEKFKKNFNDMMDNRAAVLTQYLIEDKFNKANNVITRWFNSMNKAILRTDKFAKPLKPELGEEEINIVKNAIAEQIELFFTKPFETIKTSDVTMYMRAAYDQLVLIYSKYKPEDIRTFETWKRIQYLYTLSSYFYPVIIDDATDEDGNPDPDYHYPEGFENLRNTFIVFYSNSLEFRRFYRSVYMKSAEMLVNKKYSINNGGVLLWDTI